MSEWSCRTSSDSRRERFGSPSLWGGVGGGPWKLARVESGAGIQEADALSFSCTLFRTDALRGLELRAQASPGSDIGADIALMADLTEAKWRKLVDWQVHCDHVTDSQPGTGPVVLLPPMASGEARTTPRGGLRPSCLLSVQIATANQHEACRQAVKSLLAHTANSFELHLWTNCAPQETLRWINEIDDARILHHPAGHNAGFIGPHNEMAARARGRYLVVANDDVLFGPGWDTALLRAFEANPKLGAAGPRQQCGRLDSAGNGVPGHGPIDYVEGWCLCTPREVVERHGLFDERMDFAYCEDADFSLRLRALGYEVAEVPECDVEHLHACTRTSAPALEERCRQAEAHNKAILRERWADWLETRCFPQHTVIVRRDGATGDVIDLEPALAGLRERYPWSKIVLETECVDVMRYCPHVDEVRLPAVRSLGAQDPCPSVCVDRLTAGLPTAGPLILDLDDCYEHDPTAHHARAFSRAVGAPFRFPRWWHTGRAMTEAVRLLPGDRETVAFHVQASWPERTWPVERFRAVAQELAGRQPVVQVGGVDDAPLGVGRDLRGVPWDVLAACLARCRLLVSVDSALHHLAAAVGTRCVVVFGCSRPDVVATPLTHAVWHAELDCAGCLQAAPPPARRVRCRRERIHCLLSISAERVLAEIDEAD